MKSQTLMFLTTIISCLYFGLMKWITTMPLDGMSFFIIATSTCLFIGWMIATLVTANDITKKEDAE